MKRLIEKRSPYSVAVLGLALSVATVAAAGAAVTEGRPTWKLGNHERTNVL